MKKIALVFVFVLTTLSSFGQRIRYKDLFPQMAGMSNTELKNSLKEYLAEDVDHPNANFRLALVYEANYKTSDLLTNYEYARANAQQAQLRYIKAKQLVDEREVNRNNDYYFPVFKTFDSKGKPNVEFSLVSKKISGGYDSCGLFLSKTPPIYRSFTHCVNSYDQAVKTFADINKTFLNLDDLYLYYDADTDKQFGELKASYDSAKFYFDRYIELINAYPIAYHKQKYSVKPIVTYRLDGLITRMNFLTDNVEFWDYGAWVDQIRKSVNTEIAGLRTKLVQNEEKLDETLKKIDTSTGEGITPFKPDKQMVFNLNNYDRQSLVLSLLSYKAFKQGWLIQSKTLQPDTVNRERNAEMYSTLIYSNRSADTLIGIVKERLRPEKVRKHKDFLLKYYGNIDGLQRFASSEQEYVKQTFGDYTSQLRNELLALALPVVKAENNKPVKFGRLNISLAGMVPTPELMEKGEPMTLQSKKSPDGSLYVAGIFKPDKKANNLVTFVAHVGADGKPAWIKNFDFKIDTLSKVPDANNLLGPMELTKEGCAFLVRSTGLVPTGGQNTFVYLSEKGEQKFKIKLKENGYPRKLNYSEKSNSFVVLMKGQEEKPSYSASEPITLLSINILGDMMWTRSVEVTGTITDLINVIDGYLVVGNYRVIRDLSGKEFRTHVTAGESNPFLIKLNERGELVKISPVAVPKSVYITGVIKVDDNSIHLLGWESTLDGGINRSLSSSDKIIYVMTNHFCQIVCSVF